MQKLSCILLLFLLSGCTKEYLNQYVFKPPRYLEKQLVQTSTFVLYTRPKVDNKDQPVKIYLEGDSHPLSTNPTPRNPIAFKLALRDNYNFIYIARPCQYTIEEDSYCNAKYWGHARYSTTVVDSISSAIDTLKNKYKFKQIELIGFSGGGGLAVLLAALRDDVISIRTVAGNLNLKLMDKHHNSRPLHESLDPLLYARQIRHIPQIHFIGKRDWVVPPIIARSFVEAQSGNVTKIYETKFTHSGGWIKEWPKLLKEEFKKNN